MADPTIGMFVGDDEIERRKAASPDAAQAVGGEAPKSNYGLEELAHCKHCDDGDPVKFLDIDGTSCKVSGDTFGELCHAADAYWWPCPRWRDLIDRMRGAESNEGYAITDARMFEERAKATDDLCAELYEALKAIIDCYGLGQPPETFVAQVSGFISDGRAVLTKAAEVAERGQK